jgi:hypothetical protein
MCFKRTSYIKKKLYFFINKETKMYIINVVLDDTIIDVNVFTRYTSAQYCAYDWSVNKIERLGFKPKFEQFKTYMYKVEYDQLSTYIDKPHMIFY